MPVAFFVDSTVRRGAEKFALDLADALTRRCRDVLTFALTSGTGESVFDLPILGRRSRSPRTINAVRRELRRASVGVAFGSSTVPVCAAASALAGRPFVYRNIGDPAYWSGAWTRRVRVRAYLHRAATVVAGWDGAATQLMDSYGVPAERLRVIPTGAPAADFPHVGRSQQMSAREQVGVSAADQVVGYVGALSKEKNSAAAIRVAAEVGDSTLLVAGSGPQRAELERLAAQIAPGRVRFLGSVGNPQVVFAASDVLLLPSETEGTPGVAIEAGLTGIPVVATDVGGVGEIVLHEDTGFVVPRGDVTELARATRLAIRDTADLGARARKHCLAHFEIDVIAQAWDELLTDLDAW